MFDIVEKFITISGEAPMAGRPVYLVRFSGCNLNCSYCDTPYRDEVNLTLSPDELASDIKDKIADYPYLSVLFTGGEPLLPGRQPDIIKIIKKFKKTTFIIETNGSVRIDDFKLKNCIYVADWKAPSSGEDDFYAGNLKKLRSTDCIKFVAAGTDLEWLKEKILYLKNNYGRIRLFVSPQHGSISAAELSAFITENKLPASLSLQLHKMIWPDKDRGV